MIEQKNLFNTSNQSQLNQFQKANQESGQIYSKAQEFRSLLQDIVSLREGTDFMSTTEQRLEWFGKKAIATIEELEQQTTALVNEAVDEIDFNMLQRDYEKLVADYVKAQGLLKIVETERNTLSQVLRILASGGEIDPVSETEQAQAEMKDENV